jgi:hypothetical protein
MGETYSAEMVSPQQKPVDLALQNQGVIVFPHWLCRVKGPKDYSIFSSLKRRSMGDNCAGVQKELYIFSLFKQCSVK